MNPIDLTSDTAFKIYLEDKEMLEFLLKAYIPDLKNCDIESIHFLNNEENSENISDLQEKTLILDIQVALKRKGEKNIEIINVEIQKCANRYFADRTVIYNSRTLSKQLKKGEDYKNIRYGRNLRYRGPPHRSGLAR